MPSQKDGNKSPKERSLGLNAKNVASLNKVKMSRKMKNRFTTHKMVLGIFSLISIMLRAVQLQSNPSSKRTTKEGIFIGSNNDFMLIFTPDPLFLVSCFCAFL